MRSGAAWLSSRNTTSGEESRRGCARNFHRRVNVNTAGAQAGDSSSWATISADGRFVGFWSEAKNLAPPKANPPGQRVRARTAAAVGSAAQEGKHCQHAPVVRGALRQ